MKMMNALVKKHAKEGLWLEQVPVPEVGPNDALIKIQFVDRLEQVPRSKKFAYRREAYRAMAERLGPAAIEVFERVYGQP